jgi:hypothetical protein
MRRNKYNARKTVVDGINFDSKKEAKRWCDLQLLLRAGEIADLERQVTIHLDGRDGPILTPTGRLMAYKADFRYYDMKLKCIVIEDVKGFKDKVYPIKKAILAAMGVDIFET